jgi:hypothetical protein
MLDRDASQGASLRPAMRNQPAARLTAMVSHGDLQTELPLLWQLCAALQGFGHHVAVLDATAAETPKRPGLQQMLDGSHVGDAGYDAAGLSVWPAAAGMQALATACDVLADAARDNGADAGAARELAAGAMRSHLARALRPHDLVLLYATPDRLSAWMGGSALAPLLATSPVQSRVLAAYQSLRQLLGTGIAPTLATITTETGSAPAASAQAARTNLAHCASVWLGRQIDVLGVRTSLQAEFPSADVRRLALCLIERAVPLDAAAAAASPPSPDGPAVAPSPLVRHDAVALGSH